FHALLDLQLPALVERVARYPCRGPLPSRCRFHDAEHGPQLEELGGYRIEGREGPALGEALLDRFPNVDEAGLVEFFDYVSDLGLKYDYPDLVHLLRPKHPNPQREAKNSFTSFVTLGASIAFFFDEAASSLAAATISSTSLSIALPPLRSLSFL